MALIAQTAPDSAQTVGALEQRVQKLLQEQKPQLAIPLLRQILALDPKNLNAQANLGVLEFFQGGYAEAIPHLRSALEAQPNLGRVEVLLGIAEKRTGDPKSAQTHLEHAFANVDDKNIRIQAGLELAELDAAAGRLEGALQVAAKLEELAPENPRILLVAYQISRQVTYKSLLSAAVAAPDSAEMHMMMAGELGRQGDRANAIAQYRQAIRLNPQLPGAHFELAEQLRTAPDPALSAEAEKEFRAAIEVNRYDALSWRQLAGILAAKGDFKNAEAHYRKALAIQPNDSDAEAGLAIVLISTNRPDEAISLLENALRDDPANLTAHYRLSVLYRRAGRTAEAQRETEAFRHYQDVKDKLGKVFKQFTSSSNPI